MKKILCFFMVAILVIFCNIVISKAATIPPEYDATFDNNKGIFYANGNDITINKNSIGETVICWNGGEQIVPETVRIIGGGKEGTNNEETDIKMEAGTISFIYGGGASLNENSIAIVGKSKVEINGGTVLQTVYGGGLLFATVNESNVEVNGGLVKSICGGGSASASIGGVAYAAGTEDNMINSKSRVNTANIEIDGGTINTNPSTYGTIFGGGQGYSYVGATNLTINDGDLSNATVTLGGANGYTGTANAKIEGGTINVIQSVNRGILKDSKVVIKGGIINSIYVGAEEVPDTTGTVEKANVSILGGNTTYLYPGKSDNSTIVIDQNNYKSLNIQGTVENNEIGTKEIEVRYYLDIVEDEIEMNKDEKKKITAILKTEPKGYESLFEDKQISWESTDENIATVDETGNIIAKSEGIARISATMENAEDSVIIKVFERNIAVIFLIITIVLITIVALLVFIFS